MPEEKQETTRPERVSVMLSVDEKRAVRVVAGLKRLTESDLLRNMNIDEIVAEYDRLTALAVA